MSCLCSRPWEQSSEQDRKTGAGVLVGRQPVNPKIREMFSCSMVTSSVKPEQGRGKTREGGTHGDGAVQASGQMTFAQRPEGRGRESRALRV